MSAMVSNLYPLKMDYQSMFAHDSLMDLGSNADQLPLFGTSTMTNVWASQRTAAVPRRNSTSSMSSIAATRSRMNISGLTSASNIIPESSAATLSAAAAVLNSVAEERFRSRAYSEGASSLSSDSQLQPQQQPIASSRYKTELCRPFEENGKCKYGDKCQFAHGKQELRQLIRHPKYKTELCRTFHTSGFCPYGPRCHFIHNQDDTTNRIGSTNNLHQSKSQHNAAINGILSSVGIPIPNSHLSERNHFEHRPARINLLTKQLSAGPTFGNSSISPTSQSPLQGSPTFMHNDQYSTALMSPTSPNAGHNGNMFTFNNGIQSMMSKLPYDNQSTPPLTNYDMLHSQGSLLENNNFSDDAFEGPPTPPDSDRESMTGSPSSRQQRLPIFRCLSQSE